MVAGKPIARRAIIVCPTSLVKNWSNELNKWLDGRVDHIALSEACREVVTAEITKFLSPKGPMVLIISYETFRIHCSRFYVRGACTARVGLVRRVEAVVVLSQPPPRYAP